MHRGYARSGLAPDFMITPLADAAHIQQAARRCAVALPSNCLGMLHDLPATEAAYATTHIFYLAPQLVLNSCLFLLPVFDATALVVGEGLVCFQSRR